MLIGAADVALARCLKVIKLISSHCGKGSFLQRIWCSTCRLKRQHLKQGCQIFPGTTYQNGKNYTKWQQNIPNGCENIPNGHEISSTSLFPPGPPKLTQILIFNHLATLISKWSLKFQSHNFWLEVDTFTCMYVGRVYACMYVHMYVCVYISGKADRKIHAHAWCPTGPWVIVVATDVTKNQLFQNI
jgi:hypothetical protein